MHEYEAKVMWSRDTNLLKIKLFYDPVKSLHPNRRKRTPRFKRAFVNIISHWYSFTYFLAPAIPPSAIEYDLDLWNHSYNDELY